MKRQKEIQLDFEVDKLTNSIENALSGEIFETEVVRIASKDKKLIKASDFGFEWHKEFKDLSKEIYKLNTINNPTILQGLISISDRHDHIFMHLIESTKLNKGKEKLYKGVAGNLVAYACKISFEKNYDGVVSFESKTKLIEHYQKTLGAKQFGRGNRMFIDTKEAFILVKQYFKNFIYGKL